MGALLFPMRRMPCIATAIDGLRALEGQGRAAVLSHPADPLIREQVAPLLRHRGLVRCLDGH